MRISSKRLYMSRDEIKEEISNLRDELKEPNTNQTRKNMLKNQMNRYTRKLSKLNELNRVL